MCILTGIITALGSIGTAVVGAFGGSVVGGTVAGATVAGTTTAAGIAATTGISAGAAVGIGAATTALGIGAVGAGALGLSKMLKGSESTGNISVNAETLQQSPTSLSDTVSKSASTMADANRKSNPLSSLRIKQQTNAIKQETGVNTGSEVGTGLNLGG